MTPRLDSELLHILQHSLGVDGHGQGKRYRNHYVTHADDQDMQELVAMGLMKDHGEQGQMTGGLNLFTVTAEGEAVVDRESPPPPKLTRSQKRYRRWLDFDSGPSFGEWLKSPWSKEPTHG